MLALKVEISSSRVSKTMRFTANMSVSEACKEIREKTEQVRREKIQNIYF